MLTLVLVVYWCLVYVIVGSIVLACVPTFRVTLLNVAAFVLGAWPGTYAYFYAEMFWSDHFTYRFPLIEHYPVASGLMGALVGGSLFVWAKLRFVKSTDANRLL